MLPDNTNIAEASLKLAVIAELLRRGLINVGIAFTRSEERAFEREESSFVHQLDPFLKQPRPSTASERLNRRRERVERQTTVISPIQAITRGRFRRHFGAWAGDPHSADNDRIDQDLARAYSGMREAD